MDIDIRGMDYRRLCDLAECIEALERARNAAREFEIESMGDVELARLAIDVIDELQLREEMDEEDLNREYERSVL